jgi:hypothetical protein
MGHAADEEEDDNGRRRTVSEGVKTYTHEIHVQNLLTTVNAIRYPDQVDLSRLRRSA